jgi:sucrose-6-phosphate hydrolase SacC (GH32 family)
MIREETFLKDFALPSTMPRLFFAPENKKHGDFWLIEKDGVIHNIFIENSKDKIAETRNISHGNSYGLATSKDGFLWNYEGKIKEPGPKGSWNARTLWAMQVFKDNKTHPGKYLMIYSAVADAKGPNHPYQQFGMASSDDLRSWKDFDENPIIKNTDTGVHYYPNTMHRFCWRDANIHKIKDSYYAILAAKDIASPYELAGCTALLKSDDLKNWDTQEPIFSPSTYREVETPHINKIGDKYFLIFGENERSMSMRFAVADNFFGPYVEPELNIFTPAQCYAGMIFNHKSKDLFYHWIMDKNHGKNERYLTPPKLVSIEDENLFLKLHPDIEPFFPEIDCKDILACIRKNDENRGRFILKGTGKETVLAIRNTDSRYSRNVFFTITGSGLSIRDLSMSDFESHGRFIGSRTVPINIDSIELELFIEDKFLEIYINGYFVYATVLAFTLDDIKSIDIDPEDPWKD